MRDQNVALPVVSGMVVHLLSCASRTGVVPCSRARWRVSPSHDECDGAPRIPHVQFVPEVPVALFLRLAGFPIKLSRVVLRRLTRVHNGRIHRRIAADGHARRVQHDTDNLNQFRSEVGCNETLPKLDERGPIRHLLEMCVEAAERRHAHMPSSSLTFAWSDKKTPAEARTFATYNRRQWTSTHGHQPASGTRLRPSHPPTERPFPSAPGSAPCGFCDDVYWFPERRQIRGVVCLLISRSTTSAEGVPVSVPSPYVIHYR